jgi:hypothetical protein
LAVTTVAVGAARGTHVLSAQEIRCWDVACVVNPDGTLRCVETPKPCPQAAGEGARPLAKPEFRRSDVT